MASPTDTAFARAMAMNLLNWDALGSATDLGGGLFGYQDAAATNLASRFYQITAP